MREILMPGMFHAHANLTTTQFRRQEEGADDCLFRYVQHMEGKIRRDPGSSRRRRADRRVSIRPGAT
ncbi:MAG: hypothetical protein OXI01_07225 [Albidovulum sp.]|nr:hypothetical protein [Albidovulum sp.]